MAHVGRFGPVAFRRDLNLNATTNTAYLARSWFCRINFLDPCGLVGMGGDDLMNVHEDDPLVGHLVDWQQAWWAAYGRSLSWRIWITATPGADWTIHAQLLDQILGNLGVFKRTMVNESFYSTVTIPWNAADPIPHPSIFNPSASTVVDLYTMSWPLYNFWNP